MIKRPATPFSAPIPGESLTAEPGSQPWEKPPQFADMDSAMEFVTDRMMKGDNLANMMQIMKKGMPAEAVARATAMQMFANGKVNPDTAMLMGPALTAVIGAMAAKGGVKTPLLMKKNKKKMPMQQQFHTAEKFDEQAKRVQAALTPREPKGLLGL